MSQGARALGRQSQHTNGQLLFERCAKFGVRGRVSKRLNPSNRSSSSHKQLRDGRSFSLRGNVRALQNGNEVLRMIASFHSRRAASAC